MTYTTVHTIWAERLEKGRLERFVSAAELAEAERGYRIRYLAGLDPTWRIVDGTELWDITGVMDGRGRDRELILSATRHVPGDTSG